ncbi:MAG: class I SAM-dependent methyltransferase [Actinomycetota bacterium]
MREVVLRRADPQPTDRCVDLGAGSGFMTLPLAGQVEHVVAVDVAPLMLNLLASRATAAGLRNVHTRVDDMTKTEFPPLSLSLVVSSYALHSVPHQDKLVLLGHAFQWLAPGGRIVIADMMLGHGGSGRDRDIAATKIRRLAACGPAGWWRAARNTAQLGLGVGENRPASPAWWVGALQQAGFTKVFQTDVVAEAGVVSGVKPAGG